MTASPATLPRGHQTMLLAHRAMVRDLGRTARSARQLAVSRNAPQAHALRDYVDKLFTVIEHHHEGEDAYLWPQLRERGADAQALALLNAEHEELTKFLHAWHEASRRLGADREAAAELAERTEEVSRHLTEHAGDEERELLDRLAPALDAQVWKGFETHMRKTAPGWTLRFMPAWLLAVSGPEDRGGVPVAPLARVFQGRLERTQRAAFGEHC